MKRRRRRKRGIIGADVGSSSVKLAQATFSSKGFYVEGFGVSAIQTGNGSAAIRDALRQSRLRGRRTATAVPGSSAMLRRLELPPLSPKELPEAVRWESEQVLPLDPDTAATDYLPLDTEKERTEVLLAAAPKPVVEDRIRILEAAGLTPRVVDVESLALARCVLTVEPPEEGSSVALVHIGAHITYVVLLRGEMVPFVRDVLLAGEHFTETLAEGMGVPFEDAEQIKRTAEGTSPEEVLSIVGAVVNELGDEIARTLYYYRVREGGVEPDRVLLTGGGSKLTGLGDSLSERLGKPVLSWNPLARSRGDRGDLDTHLIKDVGPLLPIALGLSLREEEG